MKKIVVFFIIVSTCLSFYINYLDTNTSEFLQLVSAEDDTLSSSLVTLNDEGIYSLDPNQFFNLILSLSKKYNANIYRTHITYQNNIPFYRKYVLLNNPDRYFSHFILEGGRFLTTDESIHSSLYLSTDLSDSPDQIGHIYDFAKNDHLQVVAFHSFLNEIAVSGTYKIQTDSQAEFIAFASELMEYGLNIQISSLSNTDIYPSPSILPSLFNRILHFFTLVFTIYYFLGQSKNIGILKLHGVSVTRIWWITIGRLTTIVYCMIFILLSFLSIVAVITPSITFTLSVVKEMIVNFIWLYGLFILSILYLNSISVNMFIKGRKKVTMIFALNYTLKIIFSIIFIVCFMQIAFSLPQSSNQKETLKTWEHVSKYGFFEPIFLDESNPDIDSSLPYLLKEYHILYPILNEWGSIFVEAGSYSTPRSSASTSEQLLSGFSTEEKISRWSMYVNPNYLLAYPVFDIYGNQILIDENEEDWILLIPEPYQYLVERIIHAHEKDRNDALQYAKNICNQDFGEKWTNNQQNIKIIWTKGGQHIFSFNSLVAPESGNMILDPVIEVMTLNNRVEGDVQLTYGNSNAPLKIKLIDGDPKSTYEYILPKLKELKVDNNIKGIRTIYESIDRELDIITRYLLQTIIISALPLFGIICILIQNALIQFDRNMKKFMIMRLLGVGFIKTYQKCYSISILIFIGQTLISVICTKMLRYPIEIEFVFATILLFLLELCVASICLIGAERKSTVNILRRG